MMRPANFLLLALLATCNLSAFALEVPFPTRENAFVPLDSGIDTVPSAIPGKIKWMDNNRVIFTALRHDVPHNPVVSYPPPEEQRIVIWDTVDNTVTPYADGLLLCYNDGNIAYTSESARYTAQGAVSKVKIGVMGKEVEVEKIPNTNGSPSIAGLFNSVSCHSYSNFGYTSLNEIFHPESSREVVRLHEDHGYLDLFSVQQNPGSPNAFIPKNTYPIKYYRPNQAPIELHSVPGGITRQAPVFSNYANAYVLDQLITSKPFDQMQVLPRFPDGAANVRLLTPEGKISTINYPARLYRDVKINILGVNVTRAGLVVALLPELNAPTREDKGLLLIRGEKFIKIMEGPSPELDVSPDGCKIAFSNGELSNARYTYRLKMINVCSGKN